MVCGRRTTIGEFLSSIRIEEFTISFIRNSEFTIFRAREFLNVVDISEFLKPVASERDALRDALCVREVLHVEGGVEGEHRLSLVVLGVCERCVL